MDQDGSGANSKCAVVFFVFNRPEHTRKVLAAIRAYAPEKLYVVADGPRSGNDSDVEKTLQVRELFDGLDWGCDVERVFSDQNLGLRNRILTGLDFAFKREAKAIILEDDCLPDPSFFTFCNELMHRERPSSLGLIAGTNFAQSLKSSRSYHYSTSPSIWGWATWQEVWHSFRAAPQVEEWSREDAKALGPSFTSIFERFFFTRLMRKAHLLNTWDVSFAVWIRSHSLLTAVPSSNLVENIGFGEGATHTAGESPDPVLPATGMDFPLRHPAQVVPDVRLDRWIWRQRARSWLWYAARHPFALIRKIIT